MQSTQQDVERGAWKDQTNFVHTSFNPAERFCVTAYADADIGPIPRADKLKQDVMLEARTLYQRVIGLLTGGWVPFVQYLTTPHCKRLLSSMSIVIVCFATVTIFVLVINAFQGNQVDPGIASATADTIVDVATTGVSNQEGISSSDILDYAQHWIESSPSHRCRYYVSHQLLVYRQTDSSVTQAWMPRISTRNYDTWWIAESSMVYWADYIAKYCTDRYTFLRGRLFNQIMLEYQTSKPDTSTNTHPTPGPTVITMDLDQETAHCIQQELLLKVSPNMMNDAPSALIRKSFHKPTCTAKKQARPRKANDEIQQSPYGW